MEEAIKDAIERQAKKLIERYKRDSFVAIKYQRRFRLRTGQDPAQGREAEPMMWKISPHFNPLYCIKHSRYLAKTIWKKILERKYEVTPAVKFEIPKDSGGVREIMLFSIPDAAIANLFNRKLRDRNKNLQSPFCYSYRKDRTIFDAVLQTHALLKGDKTYVVQYDFSKYFDSIKHEYLDFILDKNDFFVSPTEKYVIKKFLKHKYALIQNYKDKNFSERNTGVPQGCSLSLFLSNISSHELDKKLEAFNGTFVRFADDIVCVARNYEDASRIEEAFKGHCHYSGISINYEKSPGICLLARANTKESREFFIDNGDVGKISMIEEFDYIGHKFSKKYVQISGKGIVRIKQKLSRIIYIHLLHNLKRGLFEPARIGDDFYDWDLVTCINELRKTIYGGLKEKRLKAFLEENRRISRFKGLMSFYPLVNSIEQFSMLDGWLVSILRRALKKRSQLIKEQYGIAHRSLPDREIVSGAWYKYQKGIQLETAAPSFVLGWRAARKAFKQYGLTDFEVPRYYSMLAEFY
jgi:RNA-directed DNA polymerase